MNVLIGGSRHLTEEALVGALLDHVAARSWRVLTGCAPGIDATVRRLAVERRVPLTVYAVGARDGDDWGGRFGARQEIRALEVGGSASVVWSAGGLDGPLRVRLARRTCAAVAAADWVLMVTAPDSRGSRLALQEARRLGKRWREYACG